MNHQNTRSLCFLSDINPAKFNTLGDDRKKKTGLIIIHNKKRFVSKIHALSFLFIYLFIYIFSRSALNEFLKKRAIWVVTKKNGGKKNLNATREQGNCSKILILSSSPDEDIFTTVNS